MPITGSVTVSGVIAPTSELDIYPVTNPRYGLGGLRTVGTTADRNAITMRRREVGMVVYVSSENKYYHLIGGTADANWQEFVLGSGGVTGATGATGATGEKGETGEIPTDYVESLNSLTGPLQISAGSNIQITVEGTNTLVITSLDGTFDSDITASFAPEKSFGKYLYGQRVPSLGKTAVEVIRDALLDSVNPIVGLTSSTSIAFNQTAISNVLVASHAIQTIGATGATGVLQWRRNNTGSWTTLNSFLFNPSGTGFVGSFTHGLSDTAFNSHPFNYRYIVFDSRGASAEATLNISPAQYRNPDGTLNQAATNTRGGVIDSTTAREKGNRTTTLSGSCSRTNSLVPITHYIIERQENGVGNWFAVKNDPISGNPSTFTIPSLTDTPNAALNSVRYRLRVSDAYIDSLVPSLTAYNNPNTGLPSAITFHNLIWYGPTASPPSSSANFRNGADVLSGGLSAFNPGITARNPFRVLSGSQYTNVVVALPSPRTITNALDIDNNRDLRDFFVTGGSWAGVSSILDYANNPTAYNVYLFRFDVPYDPEARIDITRNQI